MIEDGGQVVEYGREARRFPWRKVVICAGVVLGVTLGVWAGWYYGYARPRLYRVRCQATLQAIGSCVMLYQQDYLRLRVNAPNLQAIALTQNLPEMFSCPAGERSSIAGKANPYAYIYVGASVAVDAPPTAVLILEDPANHGMEGGHVLDADGSVVFMPLGQLMACFNDLAAGRNPPTSAAMSDAVAAEDYRRNWKGKMAGVKGGVWVVPATRAVGGVGR